MLDFHDSTPGRIAFIDEPGLVSAIRAIAPDAQIIILPSRAVDQIPSPPDSPAWRSDPKPANLTPREQAVLARVAIGETNAEIADAMGLACNTVKAYLQSLMRKLGARNRVEALTFARTYGVI